MSEGSSGPIGSRVAFQPFVFVLIPVGVMVHQRSQWFLKTINNTVQLQTLRRFFLMGCQKSGTTWLQHLCDAHPELACSGEGHFSDVLIPLLMDGIKEYNNTSKAKYEFNALEVAATCRFAIDQIMLKYVPTDPEKQKALVAIGDKTPETACWIPPFSQLFDDARFIQIIRDPRDGAVSGWAHLKRQDKQGRFAGFAQYVAYYTREHWVNYITQARKDAAEFPHRYMEIRYEQLQADGLRAATQLFAFLGVSTSEPVVSACLEAASFEAMSGGRKPGQEQADSHIRKGLVGDWVNQFDQESHDAFLKNGGDLASELGYDLGFSRV